MTARHFTELICWQLATELRAKIGEVIARPSVARDFRFCDQLRNAARSVPANIAEGFGKYDPPEFRRYLNIAAGSLHEIQNHLRDALSSNYLGPDEFRALWLLSRRTRGAILALMAYLQKCPRKEHRRAGGSKQQGGRSSR